MRPGPASICLLAFALLSIAGCRTRLPVEPVPSTATGPTGLTAFLDGTASPERRTADPLRPFLAEVRTDRLQDMVRMDLLTDHRRGPFAFLTLRASVCVPGRDH